MLKKLNWQAYSADDRNKSIDAVKEIISRNDGCIMNFTMFSDLALSLSIEIEENRIFELHNALSSILKISDLDRANIHSGSKKEVIVFMNISFKSGRGELKNAIPAIPG